MVHRTLEVITVTNFLSLAAFKSSFHKQQLELQNNSVLWHYRPQLDAIAAKRAPKSALIPDTFSGLP